MGSIQDIESIALPNGQSLKQAQESIVELTTQINRNSPESFKIHGLAADSESCLTGMRDELVLLSWCIVLLRTSEEGQASFEWAYSRQSEILQSQCLNTAQVIPSLQRSVEQAGTEIQQNISRSSVDQSSTIHTPTSLVLSTSLLSQNPTGVDDKVRERLQN